MPISNMFAAAVKSPGTLAPAQLATRLPEVQGFIEARKKELCENALRKRITKKLMVAASTLLQSIGHGGVQNLALAGRFEEHFTAKLTDT